MHEELADVPPLYRIAFIGLWCEADRQGRLADRPRRLKAAILPYDDIDFGQVLAELEQGGFIQRYVVGDLRLIQVRGFTKHQRPQTKEAASELPAPPSTSSDAGAFAAGTASDDVETEPDTDPAPTEHQPGPEETNAGTPGREGNGRTTEGREGGTGEGKPTATPGSRTARRRRGRPRVKQHPQAVGVCEFLTEQARRWKPDVRIDTTSQRSLADMDRLLRIDERDPEKVRRVITWLFTGGYGPTGDFDWRPNVLSGHTLRKQWDRLEIAYDRDQADDTQEWTGR